VVGGEGLHDVVDVVILSGGLVWVNSGGGGVVPPILGGLDNRKEVGEGELFKVVRPLHGAGMWLAHL